MEQSFADYMRGLIANGFIAKDGTPLKCSCGCKEFEEYQAYYEDYYGKVEYSLRCVKCKEHNGTWAYGSWTV